MRAGCCGDFLDLQTERVIMFDEPCYVNMLLADEWLDSSSIAADLQPDSKIDFRDYAILAEGWLEKWLWPSQ